MECGLDAAVGVPPSGASNRMEIPAPFGDEVAPAIHPHESTAASMAAISGS